MAKDKYTPKPEMLGKGLAKKAEKALQGRKDRIDSAVDKATKGKKKPRKK